MIRRATLLSGITILCLFFNRSQAQTVSTGQEQTRAIVNFTERAQYDIQHPPAMPAQPIEIENEDDESRPEHDQMPPADEIHARQTQPQNLAAAPVPMLPISPNPADTFQAYPDNNTYIPPDTHGAVDSNYCLTTVNCNVRIQTRAGATVSTVSLNTFFNPVNPTNGTFDPRVHYDPYTNRWILVCVAHAQSTSSCVLIAISQTSDPTGNWYEYNVLADPAGTNWFDYPDVGFNKNWIVITGNFFTNAANAYSYAKVFAFNKNNVINNVNANYTSFTQNSSFTICPALTYDNTVEDIFMAESWNGPSGLLRLWKIIGPVGSETMSSVGYPSSAIHWWYQGNNGNNFIPQVDTTSKLQANDDRITQMVYMNNKLWTAHNAFFPTGTPTRCSVMWWQFDTLASPSQIGFVDDPTGVNYYFFPSITVNANNDALIGFSTCSAVTHPSAAYALRVHTDVVDSVRQPLIYRHGLNKYGKDYGSGRVRWGDYSAAAYDPKNPYDFWTLQEATQATADRWDTWWAHVLCSTPATPASVTMPSPICTGVSGVYTIPAVAGANSYTWTVSGTGWSGTSTTNSISLLAGTGTATVTVTANGNCSNSTPYTFNPAPTPVPLQGTITGAASPCPNSTATYTVGPLANATSYTWTVSGTGWSGSSTTNTINVTVGTGTGTLTVTGTGVCGTGPVATLTVTPSGLPAAATGITAPSPICVGQTAAFSTPAIANATSYVWTVAGTGWSGSSTTSSINVTVGSGLGTLTVAGANTCDTGTSYTLSSIQPDSVPLTPVIGALPAPCPNTTATYSVTPIGNATSYTWTVSGTGWSGNSNTSSINVTVGTGTGTLTCTATGACGTSPAATLVVTPASLPANATGITVPSPLCIGQTATFSTSAIANATSYVWTVSGTGWSGSSTTSSINVTVGSGLGTITVAGLNACDTGVAFTVNNIQPDSVPLTPVIGALPAPCPNTTATYSVTPIGNATSYTWTVAGTGWSGNSNTSSINVTVGTGTGTLTCTATGACGTSPAATLVVTPAPLPANAQGITVSGPICIGQTISCSTNAIADATSYVWTISGTGWSGTSTTNTITVTVGTGIGTISVAGLNACDTGAAFTVNGLIPDSIPARPVIAAQPVPCPNTTATYSVTAIPNANSYVWTVTGPGWSGSSTTASINVTVGTGTGTLTCAAVGTCGTGVPDTMIVTPAPLPGNATAITASGPLCSGSTVTFTTPVLNNATSYVWTVSGTGWSGSSTTNSINVTVGTGTGTITVAGLNSCDTGVSFTLNNLVAITVPTSTFTVSSHNTYIDTNVTVTYTGNAPATATYNWDFDGGVPPTGTTQGPHTVHWSTAGMKHITLSVDDGGCVSAATATDSVLVADPADLKAIVNDKQVDIVPNPNNGTFDIVFGANVGHPINIELADMQGKIVYQQQFDQARNNKITINTQNLPAAVYTAVIRIGEAVVNKKVTIFK